MTKALGTVCAGTVCALATTALAGTVQINEIRIDHFGTDTEEYVELIGAPGESLDGLTYIVIGDGAGGSGTIEMALDLTGLSINGAGFFLIVEDTFSLPGTPDLILSSADNGLNFENSDNVNHMLVADFTGSVDLDLDADDDGVLDVEPWSALVDCIGLVETVDDGDLIYCDDTVGPDGTFVPGHVYRCFPAGAWRIGIFDIDADPVDTPGTVNPDCPDSLLSVVKTGTTVAISGGQATYTLTVQNDGTMPSLDVEITDFLPVGFTFVSESSPADVTLVSMAPNVEWSTPSVDAKEVVVIEVTLDIGAVSGEIDNTVEVTTTSDDLVDDNMSTLTTTVNPFLAVAPAVTISEIRVDQPGADNDEYVELRGDTGTDLTGLTYLVIGDGAPELGSGVVESVTTLFGGSIENEDLFLVAEDTFTFLPFFLVDQIETDNGLNFENGDNVTHLLVANFEGGPGIDLDTDDDGTLDVIPWTSVVDGVGLLDADPGDLLYAKTLGFENVGPDETFVPSHVYRCSPQDLWTVGMFDPLEGNDSPASDNAGCSGDLSVTKAGTAVAFAGGQATYTIVVSNNGAIDADNVTIIDSLPVGMTFASETSPPEVSFDGAPGQDVNWSMTALSPGGSVEIVLVADIAEDADGEFENSVTVATTTGGDNPADNTATVVTTVLPIVDPPDGLLINEIRVDQPMTDDDEYFELIGFPETDLVGLTYVVIGDGAGGSGVIEMALPLSGSLVQADGLFLAVEKSFTFPVTPDLITENGLAFENSDNVTHVLVANFAGALGDDLDTDDDGVLDTIPWSHTLDAVGIVEEANPPMNTEFVYGAALGGVNIGPDGTFVPGHVYRCEPDGDWTIGVFDPNDAEANDTPGEVNDVCGKSLPCPEDLDGDDFVGVLDLTLIILNWGPCDGCAEDLDGDGMVAVLDLTAVILAWGACP